MSGNLAAYGTVGFVVATGAQGQAYSNAFLIEWQGPGGGAPCRILVEPPAGFPADEVSQFESLTQNLGQYFADGYTLPFTQENGARRFKGRAPLGWRFVGVTGPGVPAGQYLKDSTVTVYLAMLGTQAVRVVLYEPVAGTCPNEWLESSTPEFLLFSTLTVAGFEPAPADVGLRPELVNEWFSSSSGGLASLIIYAANGHMLSASGQTTYEISGADLYEVTSTWAGNGTYRDIGPYLATFQALNRTRLARIFRWQHVGAAPTEPWSVFLCELVENAEVCRVGNR